MRHLIVYSHPNHRSFCSAILETVVETLKPKRHEYVIRDLYGLGFDPVLKMADFEAIQEGRTPDDIRQEQDHIRRADILTLIYPVWWTGLPAMIKGYIDRVFSLGFAYAFDETGIAQLLKGKEAILFNTQGTPQAVYEASGMFNAMRMTSDTGILGFCGIQVREHVFFPAVPSVDDAVRWQYLNRVKEVINQC